MDTTRRSLVFASAVLLAACSSTEPNAMHRVTVSAAAFSADVIVGDEGGSVSIASAQIVLSRLKLHDDVCADEDCPPLTVGPVLIDLPLDGTTTVVLDALVPAGTYKRLQARLHASGDEGIEGFEGISVKVAGVFTDAEGVDHEFTFTSPMNVVTAVNFDEPVTVDAGTTNLTVDVDVASWFTSASGAVIDPINAANQHAIEKNIRASIRAFKDEP